MSKTQSKPTRPTNPITPTDVARMQGVVAKQHGGAVPQGSYVGRLQRVIAKTK